MGYLNCHQIANTTHAMGATLAEPDTTITSR